MASQEKEIILSYNGNNSIKLTIKNNYEEARKAIKEKLNFQDEDFNKYNLLYLDEDEDECNVEEEDFAEAFKYSKWILIPKEEDDLA